ncbi:MAG: c-type cytochrome [Dehalococcoidales bacterium]
MLKFKLLLMAISVMFFLWVMGVAVIAQEEVPPPYAGLKNPFPWSDASARETGKELYKQSCIGCHGIDGGNIAEADFGATDYPQRLEERPDFYFWILSEGALDKGMPPYQSSLSEEQRWQVLTYLWSLGKKTDAAEATPAQPPTEETPSLVEPQIETGNETLLLITPEQAKSGQPLFVTAYLRDIEEKPIENATVTFFIKVDFFGNSLMEIGDALTNDEGVATFEYTPRQTGNLEVVARYEAIETATTLTLVNTEEPAYRTETGIPLPAPGEEVFIGPKSALELGEGGTAPSSAFRLPGGILSWLLLVVIAVMVIWATYFRALYQVFGIPIRREITDTDTRLVPLVGLAIIVVLGILLVLMLVTGPYSHFHLVG